MNIISMIAKALGVKPNRAETDEPTGSVGRSLRPMDVPVIETLAEQGNLRLAADLCNELLGDGRVQAALTQRINGLLSYPLTWEPGDRKKKGVLDAIIDDFYSVSESGLRELYAMGHLLGLSLGELVWSENPRSGRLTPRLIVWNPRWLRYDQQTKKWMLQTTDSGTEIEVTPGDGHWVMYVPSETRNPWKSGAWRAVSRPYFARKAASLDWCRYNEVFGAPVRAVTAQAGASQKTIQTIVQNLDSSKGFTSVALPFGAKMELVAPSGDGSGTFSSILDWASAEISIAILGQNLTTSVQGGSYAAADVHRDVEHMIIESDAEVEATFLRNQIVKFWAEYNFGDRDVAPWPHRVTDNEKDALSAAQTLQMLGSAVTTLNDAGLDIDAEAFAVEYGLPLIRYTEADEGDDSEVGTDAPSPEGTPDTPPAVPHGEKAPHSEQERHDERNGVPPVKQMARHGQAKAVEGILYTDSVCEKAERNARPILRRQSAMLLDCIKAATSKEDLERRLEDAFPKMLGDDMESIVEKAFILADLSGRAFAKED